MRKIAIGLFVGAALFFCTCSPAEPEMDMVPYMSDVDNSVWTYANVTKVKGKHMEVVCYGDIPAYDGHVYTTETIDDVNVGDDVEILVNGNTILYAREVK